MFQSRYTRAIASILASLAIGCQPNPTTTPETQSQLDSVSPIEPTRSISHAMGISEVPQTPKRVVVLDTAPLDAALGLGIQPIGTIIYGTLPDYLPEEVKNIAIIGDGNQPNLEAILRLKPDLILGSKLGTSRQQYRLLSEIAPTVFTVGSGRATDWQENFQLYAEALGQSELAQQQLERYQQRVLQLRPKINRPSTIEISVLSTYSNRIGTYTTKSFSGTVLQDIGLARPPAQVANLRYALEFSSEAIDKLDGDYIFLIHSPSFPGGVLKEDFVTHPVWSQLQAVRQNRVCEVMGEVWATGRSLLAANQILTDVEMCLLGDNNRSR